MPTDSDIDEQLAEAEATTQRLLRGLTPLRTGQPMTSAEDGFADERFSTRQYLYISNLMTSLPQIATDALSPQDAAALAEHLGIEFDGPEHVELEEGPSCATVQPSNRTNLKRKRE
ncbi:hypothetical protein BKA82DRAFT_35635 [Pisolithus tinctorius]|uniref:Uncharacterized protein n=1 Tax=Pisolithus tinctorius Marx 270 TaxID=870435 RepID=A0A0C3NEF9_PISTI|nr:hypothetical protein BKA82DRAFT_35635 [Pisolithus tinctorius]KIN93888.1 hypothetical protein M404DRAFT_35635 [Pisolithus tinctorius Marx 270]